MDKSLNLKRTRKLGSSHVTDIGTWKKVWGSSNGNSMLLHATAAEVVSLFHSLSKVRLRHKPFHREMLTQCSKLIPQFSTSELALILNCSKKLEINDGMHLNSILQAYIAKFDDWTPHDVSCVANCIAHFRLYEKLFWKNLTKACVKWQDPSDWHHGQSLVMIVAALAKLDWKDCALLVYFFFKIRAI